MMSPSVGDLEMQILSWQQNCIRKFHPLDNGSYVVRLLPVTLANGKPFVRYAQHWLGTEKRHPVTCPEYTDPAVLDQAGKCPLCRCLKNGFDDRGARLSFLFYCFVLQEGDAPFKDEQRFRLHQWWMTLGVRNQVFDLMKQHDVLMGFGIAKNVLVQCHDKMLALSVTELIDLGTPVSVVTRVIQSATSPKRKIHWKDLQYESLDDKFIDTLE